MAGPVRCAWAASEEMHAYHDQEWGVPVHDDRTFFEFLLLEGAQAGLSWRTILLRREGYRRAFCGFDPAAVASLSDSYCEGLMDDPGIIRNRLKIASAVTNAKAFLAVQAEFGSFSAYVWGFVGGKPIVGGWASLRDVPATTALSDALSKDLKRRGFKFVGSTIIYAFMQATGLVSDHTVDCFRYAQGGA